MNSINLFALTRVCDLEVFPLFEKQLSKRDTILKRTKEKEKEFNSVINFVDTLIEIGADINSFDNFYFSYEIPQISKEFDLLRINDDKIIDIEFKSGRGGEVSKEKVKLQLIQNKHYLSHLSRKICLFTFVEKSRTFYQLLDDDNLIVISADFVLKTINEQKNCFSNNINLLFKVSNFLVSPLNTTNKFLKGDYFLTSQQEEFKKSILNKIAICDSYSFFGIKGGAGTGKTLLTFDLVKSLSIIGKCCLIHCGILSNGHINLKNKMDSVDIVPAKEVNSNFDFSSYQYIFIDECHRFYQWQFQITIKQIKELQICAIFSYDAEQTLSKSERNTNISSQIEALPSIKLFKLSDKVRTNKEIVSFIKRLLDKKSTDIKPNYPSVSVAYANNVKEAKILIKKFKEDEYTFINFTKSSYNSGTFDEYSGDYNTHHVIGQEFDNVLMLMDNTFGYNDEGRLLGRVHPNPNYLYRKLLFQGLTRVREKLTLIIINNRPLFENILSILNNESL